MTRYQKNKLSGSSLGGSNNNDKYLKYDSESSDSSSSSDSDSEQLSDLEETSDDEIFSIEDELSSLNSDADDKESDEDSDDDSDDSDEEEEETDEEKFKKNITTLLNAALGKSIGTEDDTNGEGPIISIFDEDDEEEEEENFLQNISAEEKKELLKIENQISKINHKKVPLRYQILKSHLPIEVKATAIQKLESVQKMDESSAEYHKMSGWIDGLLKIPFNKYIETGISLESSNPEEITDYLFNIRTKLDESVYGHVETKSTLLEIVASWITNPKATPTVIGLQGPPGTGKTTLIKDGVAKALNRPFSMMALGGATDASYLEGHGYTYEGSTWGRLASILMETKCMNPVIFMDELDKVSETKKGEEIIGILTHLIDYSQNSDIQDKYFAGISLDFSKALFIFSFNDEIKINPILKDRIHIIRTEPSNKESKLIIAKDYLIPSILNNVKFKKEEITFTDETIKMIIDRYADNESGVRNLKRCLESIIMKLNTLRLTYKNPMISSSPNTKLIPYSLNDFKLPMTITDDVVDKLLNSTSIVHRNNMKHLMMYC
jgi:ATP-dependent Lon protease